LNISVLILSQRVNGVVYRYLALRCRFLVDLLTPLLAVCGLFKLPDLFYLPTLPVATVIGTLKFPALVEHLLLLISI
jgi:hypothetical protein